MKTLLAIKNRLNEFYYAHSWSVNFFYRLVLAFLSAYGLSVTCGFNTIISQIWFVIAFSVACAFLPIRFMMLALIIYTAVQMFTLTTGIGIVVTVVLFILYFLYFRVDEKYGYAVLLIPLLFSIKMPILVPILLAVLAPIGGFMAVLSGTLVYFIVHFVNANSAVLSGLQDQSALSEMRVMVNEFFSYKEFLYGIIIAMVVYFAVFYIKKLAIKYVENVALCLGTGLYIILRLLVNIMINSNTLDRLISVIIFSVITLIVALILCYMLKPLDYSRTELLEFEDDDYHYYVRAVPKASIDRQSVNIKRISHRKHENENSQVKKG